MCSPYLRQGLGFPGGSGPGASAFDAFAATGGAGHGGFGGLSSSSSSGGQYYGSLAQPQSLGSGSGASTQVVGSAGGSALRLDVSGNTRVDGRIVFDGQ